MNKDVEKLRQLEVEAAEIRERVKNSQRDCRHDWGDSIFDPYEVSEPYGCKAVNQGSDIWTEPEGYHKVTKSRWSRTCKKCGLIEYTEKTGTKVVDTGPDFGN